MTESQLKTKVTKLLAQIPDLWFYKASDRWKSGIPDFIGCWRGRFFSLELKVGRNMPSNIQYYIMRMISQAGGITAVCRSVEDVQNLFERR